jgi:hypothetical protein
MRKASLLSNAHCSDSENLARKYDSLARIRNALAFSGHLADIYPAIHAAYFPRSTYAPIVTRRSPW